MIVLGTSAQGASAARTCRRSRAKVGHASEYNPAESHEVVKEWSIAGLERDQQGYH